MWHVWSRNGGVRMNEGIAWGAIIFAFGVGVGVIVAEYYHSRIEDVKSQMGQMVMQQQAQIDALQSYIADRSESEASAEDLWGHG